MVEALFIGSLISIVSLLVWLSAGYIERKKVGAKVKEAESRLQLSESRTSHLRGEVVRLKDEMEYLKQNLSQEQRDKENVVSGLQVEYQTKLFKKGSIFALSGFVVGSLIMGVWFHAQARIQVLENLMDTKVQARVAEVQLTMFREENRVLKEQNFELQKALQSLKETHAVVLAKMEMALYHFDEQKSKKWPHFDLSVLKESFSADNSREAHYSPDILPLTVTSV